MIHSALLALIPAVIGGIIALAGVFVSTKNSRSLTERQIQNTRETDRQKTYREAGAELYTLFSDWGNLVIAIHVPLYSVMKGTISYNDYLDQQIKTSREHKTDHHRMEFLISCYFPETEPYYKEVRKLLEKKNKIISEHKFFHENGADEKQFIPIFKNAQLEFEEKMAEMKSSIINEVRKYI
ncbi:MAG TPA: hypothetical protein VE079_22800 [Ensifer sp.]|nr:hypothetical protein [Ensifer sp.]